MEPRQVLEWLVYGGGAIMAVSWLLERWPKFHTFTSEVRETITFIVSAVIGCGALALMMYTPPSVLEAVRPFFVVISSTFAAVFISKAFHRTDKPKVITVEVDNPDGVVVTTDSTLTNIERR